MFHADFKQLQTLLVLEMSSVILSLRSVIFLNKLFIQLVIYFIMVMMGLLSKAFWVVSQQQQLNIACTALFSALL